MKYKKQLKKRIKEINPNLKIGKIRRAESGTSFSIVIKSLDVNLKQLEHELREVLSMPGLTLIPGGE